MRLPADVDPEQARVKLASATLGAADEIVAGGGCYAALAFVLAPEHAHDFIGLLRRTLRRKSSG